MVDNYPDGMDWGAYDDYFDEGCDCRDDDCECEEEWVIDGRIYA